MTAPIKMQKGEGDAPFNMAQLFYYRLNELMAHKTKAKIFGNNHDWYNALIEIHTQISFKLKEPENTKILTDLKKIGAYLNSPLPRNKRAASQMTSLINARVVEWLADLDREIMHQMDRHKMIFPRIDVRTAMETMRQDLGLENRG